MCLHCFYVWVKIFVSLNFQLGFDQIFDLRFMRSWSICPKSVAMTRGKCFNICLLLRPLQVRKLPFLISFTKFLGVELKQHPYRYCTRYVLVFFRVIIAWARCLNGIEMGMYHNLSVMFLYPLKIILDSLRILISFLSKMAMQSLS